MTEKRQKTAPCYQIAKTNGHKKTNRDGTSDPAKRGIGQKSAGTLGKKGVLSEKGRTPLKEREKTARLQHAEKSCKKAREPGRGNGQPTAGGGRPRSKGLTRVWDLTRDGKDANQLQTSRKQVVMVEKRTATKEGQSSGVCCQESTRGGTHYEKLFQSERTGSEGNQNCEESKVPADQGLRKKPRPKRPMGGACKQASYAVNNKVWNTTKGKHPAIQPEMDWSGRTNHEDDDSKTRVKEKEGKGTKGRK